MKRAIRTAIGLFAECFEQVAPVVEVGSRYPPGYEWLSDLRPFFPGVEYIGCDIRPGPGVDRLEDAQALTFEDGSVGTLLMFELLEHLPRPQQAVAEARRVLVEGGLFAISVPFQYRLHGFPSDYWRFTASGVDVLLADFSQRLVLAVGPRQKPAFVFAVAGDSVPAFEERTLQFCAALKDAYRRTAFQGFVSVFKERTRDLLGLLLGRADLGVWVFDPEAMSVYMPDPQAG